MHICVSCVPVVRIEPQRSSGNSDMPVIVFYIQKNMPNFAVWSPIKYLEQHTDIRTYTNTTYTNYFGSWNVTLQIIPLEMGAMRIGTKSVYQKTQWNIRVPDVQLSYRLGWFVGVLDSSMCAR